MRFTQRDDAVETLLFDRADRSKLEANPVPCLCVIGQHDPNRTALEKTAGYMANLEIEIIEGANHLTAYRDPAFVEKYSPALSEGTHGDVSR